MHQSKSTSRIPTEHFRAVAEIISYVYKLEKEEMTKEGRIQDGTIPMASQGSSPLTP